MGAESEGNKRSLCVFRRPGKCSGEEAIPGEEGIGGSGEPGPDSVRGIPIDYSSIPEDLLLPKASFIEWSSIFQNVFVNAFNAMVDSKEKQIRVSLRKDDERREILVQDTGIGVDLDEASELFKPFERRIQISAERRALGYGGTGLGLTIVRMIANNLSCTVSFIKPEKGFKTAFSLRWREIG